MKNKEPSDKEGSLFVAKRKNFVVKDFLRILFYDELKEIMLSLGGIREWNH